MTVPPLPPQDLRGDLTTPIGEFARTEKVQQKAWVRRQVSRASQTAVGLSIANASGTIDPTLGTLKLTIYRDSDFHDEDPRGPLLRTVEETDLVKEGVGVYSTYLTSDDTKDPSFITLEWVYQLDGSPDVYEFVEKIVVMQDTMPEYDRLTDNEKFIVAQVQWMFGDLYDSTEGGPHLVEEFQTQYGSNRLAQLLHLAVNEINMGSTPITQYGVGGRGHGLPSQFQGVLVKALYIEVLKHLMRSYVEQPTQQGVNVAILDRRDYLQRWQGILQAEQPGLKDAIRLLKRSLLGLGGGRLIVSGGLYGSGGYGRGTNPWFAAERFTGQVYPTAYVR